MTDTSSRPLAARFVTNVVGVTFQAGYPNNLFALSPNDSFALVREPDNEHDSNAIVVYSWPVGKIGHIGRGIAERLAPELDSGIEWDVELVEVATYSENHTQPGVTIRCSRRLERNM